ncbi:hypothetical protein E1264_18380 [Actinomadura sp. KC216]|uniref:hypothetical protein n=1 Tax=Actinomadura sp. KC216 TaxID=2530370 RepID=UPI00104CEA49|nr:hypothetical protein [Actinomadura sp. KC216]TDB86263.1 hypothetical protein E1264_18380 [Actinomadura sp. KC216]
MALPTGIEMQRHEQLRALEYRLRVYDGVSAELRDVEIRVAGPGGRETVTCAPRPSDNDRLWFWDSKNEPIAEADRIIDTAVVVGGRVQS